MSFHSWRWRAAGIALAVTLPVYLATMNLTIGFMDRGELAAVAATWGIPHATGYPTLMLLAGALVHLVPLPPVLVLNTFAALLVACGAAALTLVFDDVLAQVAPALEPGRRAGLALLGALFTGFTLTWWQQANGFEVYPLHCLMMPLVVMLGIRWANAAAAGEPGAHQAGFAFALVTGLSFTNHLTTVLLAPALILYALMALGPRRLGSALPRLIPPFALGLVPYVWLPIRSSMHPLFDWGAPRTWRAFLHHVTGADYHSWMFGDPHSFAEQTRYLAWRIPGEAAWISLVPICVGAVALARRSPRLAVLALALVITGLGFAAGYRIPDLDSYLLTAVFGLGICFTIGLLRVSESFGPRAAAVCGVALVLVNAGFHASDCNERGDVLAESFIHDLIGPLPPHALLFTDVWGAGTSAAAYAQNVEQFRRDVTVVNLELTRVSWYLDVLERQEPLLVSRAAGPFQAYRGMLRNVERGMPYRGAGVETARRAFLSALAAGARPNRAVFSTTGLPELGTGEVRVPYRLAWWLRADSSYVTEPPWTYAWRPWHGRLDEETALAIRAYGASRLDRAEYELAHGRKSAVIPLLETAAGFDPHIRPEQVSPLPLDTDRSVLETAAYYRDLDEALRVAAR